MPSSVSPFPVLSQLLHSLDHPSEVPSGSQSLPTSPHGSGWGASGAHASGGACLIYEDLSLIAAKRETIQKVDLVFLELEGAEL